MIPNFAPPTSIAEAQARKRELESDIKRIECQLGDPLPRFDREGRLMTKEEKQAWRNAAHFKMNIKIDEQVFLKDWIKERRRQVEADQTGIFDANDAREMLVISRIAMRKALAGNDEALGSTCHTIDQYLKNVA